jgi:hypothetical protein
MTDKKLSDSEWVELKSYDALNNIYKDAIAEISRLEEVLESLTGEYGFIYADRIRWRDLSIRAYKEMFSIDQDYSDHKVWIEIEDAYEGDPD